MRGNFAGDEVADHDAPGRAVHDHQVEHFRAGEHADVAQADLPAHRLIGPEQKLLAGLAARVKRARHLRAAERTVRQRAAVFAGERHALRHALVNDAGAHLREPEDVRLARAKVAALDGVVKQAEDGVAVVLIILRRVDAALGGDGMRPARGVLETKRLHLVAKFGQRGGGGGAGKPRADHNHVKLPLVGGVDQLHVATCSGPTFARAGREEFWRRDSCYRSTSFPATAPAVSCWTAASR